MKTIYTQEMFNALPVVDGMRHCPTGDYTQVRAFGSYCTFGNNCTFGHRCRFGHRCTFENTLKVQDGYPFLTFGGGGSENRTVYFYNTPEVHVRAGCFLGTLEEFRAKVLADCPEPTAIKRVQYMSLANVAAATFNPTLVK